MKSLTVNKPKAIVITCCFISALLFGSSMYIHAKAIVAQWLIENAWTATLSTGKQQPPWSWADTYPVAKISLKSHSYYLLAGITGRTLAFGPGHMSSTPLPGKAGNTVIAGHRDTHFAQLEQLTFEDNLTVETLKGQFTYQIIDISIVHEKDMSVTASTSNDTLTLITCYPFDSLSPDTQWRYVIQATLQKRDNNQSGV
ncbi:class GN sortase [Thalassotalea sp. 1_MG-2023]|uniref:class GN sortase n=1 Tax=Thalassotalea sp. 1_MG-2023 TaxID=3062680 RepID=UPI0026E2CDE9|nr:class GN sortase [Thalassotalea sp. 1_MG-2023]MDO6427932.1 class GN sortase [Thalassotalea sp. 1_MG-2023]